MSTLTDKLRKAGRESFLYGDLLFQAAEALDKTQPVKHGRWVELDYDKSFCKCSECGVNWEWNIIFDCNFNYCPSCGAIMDGGDF